MHGARLSRWGLAAGPATVVAFVAASSAAVSPDVTPKIRSVHVSNKVFAVGTENTPLTIAGKRVKVGTKLRVTLDVPAQIEVLVQRRFHGRVSPGGACVPLKHRNRHRPVCNVLKTKMTLTR